MSRHISRVAAAALLCALASGAFAKGPQGTRSAEELIDNFADKAKGVPIAKAVDLVEHILPPPKDVKAEAYRAQAKDALIKRFAQENVLGDPLAREARRQVSLGLVEMMKSKDDAAVKVIDELFRAWFPAYLGNLGWKPEAKLPKRVELCAKMKKWLKPDKD